MKKVWYTLLGCWIHRARHSGLWQVKSGHPGKGKCQLYQDNLLLIFDQLRPSREKKQSHVDVISCESGDGNNSDNDDGDNSNNDDDDDDDDYAVLQAATVLVAMASTKKFW